MAVLRLELGALRLCHTAREPVALVGEALALDRELGGLAQARAQRRGRAAALQLAYLLVECRDLLVELAQHLGLNPAAQLRVFPDSEAAALMRGLLRT